MDFAVAAGVYGTAVATALRDKTAKGLRQRAEHVACCVAVGWGVHQLYKRGPKKCYKVMAVSVQYANFERRRNGLERHFRSPKPHDTSA